MEIIEETIRYIDALHHQLAIRMDQQQQPVAEEEGDDGGSNSGGGGDDAGQQQFSITPAAMQCKQGLHSEGNFLEA